MKEQGKNEKTRLAELSDPEARNLDDAFHNMWVVASGTRCIKPLHHISINPAIGERLTDEQLMRIVEHCENTFGYKMFHHQRVIVEHVKDGRQHFHVIWNRVSLVTGKAVWPGKDWQKSKQICRDMEKELELKSPTPRKKGKAARRMKSFFRSKGRTRTRSSYRQYSKGTSHQSQPVGGLHLIVFPKRKMILFSPSPRPAPEPIHPYVQQQRKGWPEAAVLDWEIWGHRNPRRFFTLWPELAAN